MDTQFLQKILHGKSGFLDSLMEDAVKYKLQIIYSRIDRDAENKPSFQIFGFNVNTAAYFYPASTVKLPACVAALEKINSLDIDGLSRRSMIRFDPEKATANELPIDIYKEMQARSFEDHMKHILVVSDNQSFNCLYDFLGQKEFNETLHRHGLLHTKILHRLSVGLSPDQNRKTFPLECLDGEKIVYTQPSLINNEIYSNDLQNMKQGVGYYLSDSLIHEPFDFRQRNYYSLIDQHNLLRSLYYYETVSPGQRWNIKAEDYQFLYKYMSVFPRESNIPEYSDYKSYWDSYVKYFIFGNSKDSLDRNIRIFNKVGMAYGYLIDNALIVDFKNKIEFMVSAVIFVNEDGIFNDDKYEYDSIGFPFFATIGKLLYEYELSRPRAFIPDLSRYKVEYP